MIVFKKKTLFTKTPYIADIKAGKLTEANGNAPGHGAHYSGGFILFGGWIKIFDNEVPSGKRGHELYCAFGGLGVGGWSGDGTLYPWTETYDDFYNRVKSFMYYDCFDPEDPDSDPGPAIIFFDGKSHKIGCLMMAEGAHTPGIGGGTVKVKS